MLMWIWQNCIWSPPLSVCIHQNIKFSYKRKSCTNFVGSNRMKQFACKQQTILEDPVTVSHMISMVEIWCGSLRLVYVSVYCRFMTNKRHYYLIIYWRNCHPRVQLGGRRKNVTGCGRKNGNTLWAQSRHEHTQTWSFTTQKTIISMKLGKRREKKVPNDVNEEMTRKRRRRRGKEE